jgi:hypothetical protein
MAAERLQEGIRVRCRLLGIDPPSFGFAQLAIAATSPDGLDAFVAACETGHVIPTLQTAPDLLRLAVRLNATSLIPELSAFICDPTNSPSLLLPSIQLSHEANADTSQFEAALRAQLTSFIRDQPMTTANLPLPLLVRALEGASLGDIDMFLDFVCRCLQVHGRPASMLARRLDPATLTIDHQAKLLSEINFNWNFFGPNLGQTVHGLVDTSVRQIAVIHEDRNSITGFVGTMSRLFCETREEIKQLVSSVRALRGSTAELQSQLLSVATAQELIKCDIRRLVELGVAQEQLHTHMNSSVQKLVESATAHSQLQRQVIGDVKRVVEFSVVQEELQKQVSGDMKRIMELAVAQEQLQKQASRDVKALAETTNAQAQSVPATLGKLSQQLQNLANDDVKKLFDLATVQEQSVQSVQAEVAKVSRSMRNPWQRSGSLKEFDKLLTQYPLDQYQWGIEYNSKGPLPVCVARWNSGHGFRVLVTTCVPHSNNPANWSRGTAIWTFGTDD